VVVVGTYKKTDSPQFAMRGTGFVIDSGNLCVFRRSWTLIPRQAGHAFQSKLDSRSVATRGFGFLLC
jgi:hypothetical protein